MGFWYEYSPCEPTIPTHRIIYSSHQYSLRCPLRSPAFPCSHPLSPAVIGRHSQSHIIPCSLPQRPVVPRRPPPLTTIPTINPQCSCKPCIIVSQIAGPSPSLKTAVCKFCGLGRHIFCCPAKSRALGSPSSATCWAPGRLGTLGTTLPSLFANTRVSY